MSVFLDTSALYALLDAEDASHPRAAKTWTALSARDEDLVTSNYVLVETIALLQNRIGPEAVRAFQGGLAPLLRILWIDEEEHAAAVGALLTAGRRRLSLVDCASFEAMRDSGISTAFAFDRDFAEQGFAQIP